MLADTGNDVSGNARYCSYCGSTQDRYYSAETLAKILDCSPETIRGWIKDRKIDSIKVGGLRLIPLTSLEKITSQRPSIEKLTADTMAD